MTDHPFCSVAGEEVAVDETSAVATTESTTAVIKTRRMEEDWIIIYLFFPRIEIN